jgi:hypothetical protein
MDSARVIRGPRGQRLVDGSPGLIAVFRALRRLLAPRHPPHALSSLAALIRSSAAGRHRTTHHLPGHRPATERWPRVTIRSLSGSCRESHLVGARPRGTDARCEATLTATELSKNGGSRPRAPERFPARRHKNAGPEACRFRADQHSCFVFYVRPGRAARWQVGKKSPAIPFGPAGVSLVR